jgi:hypothetical protein
MVQKSVIKAKRHAVIDKAAKMAGTRHASLGVLMERIGIAPKKCADSYPEWLCPNLF